MKQRLGIAQALLNQPRLLICDEPTSALDPVGRKEILDILLAAREMTTVLFSTHILSDVERICTHVAFLNEGKTAVQGAVSEIRGIHIAKEFTVEFTQDADAEKITQTFKDFRQTGRNSFIFSGNGDRIFELLSYIAENKISVQKIERMEPSLESLFLEVANQ